MKGAACMEDICDEGGETDGGEVAPERFEAGLPVVAVVIAGGICTVM